MAREQEEEIRWQLKVLFFTNLKKKNYNKNNNNNNQKNMQKKIMQKVHASNKKPC